MDVTSDVNQQVQLWFGSQLNWVSNALAKYRMKLQPLTGKGNTKIEIEFYLVTQMEKTVKPKLANPDDVSAGEVFSLDGLRVIKATLLLYRDFLQWEIDEEEKNAEVIGASEGKRGWLDAVNDLLINHQTLGNVQPREIFVKTFIPKPESSQQPVQQQINIGQVYGQFVAGSNNGHMIQTNNNHVVQELHKLFELTQETKDLNEQQKSLVFSQIQTIQAQVMGPEPDKGIVETAFNKLNKVLIAVQTTEYAARAFEILKVALPLANKVIPGVDLIKLENLA